MPSKTEMVYESKTGSAYSTRLLYFYILSAMFLNIKYNNI